jgi:putative spermidine/putrescine transport system substrate-binding protein
LAGLAAFGVSAVVGNRSADAEVRQISMINWGGDNAKWLDKAYVAPFEKDTGFTFVTDTSGPTVGKLRTIAESGKITWDVADSVPHTAYILGKLGYLDEIDYGIVDKSAVLPAFAYQWAVADGVFSNVLTYNKQKLGKTPTGWADMWNFTDFPGRRTLWKGFNGVLEVALMADGVPFGQVYPIDVDRALRKIKEIKKQTIFWNTGAESQSLFRDGEVTMGSIWSTRANFVTEDTQGHVEYSFNQGVMVPGVWIVAKNNPAGKDVYQFIRSTQKPERQVEMLVGYGYGPSNPAASKLVPEAYQKRDPLNPANLPKQLLIQSQWYSDNYDRVYPMYLDLISS